MNNNNKLLKDIVKTRTILKEKLKNIKLNEADRINLLEDTFKPITKPLSNIIGKIDEFKTDDVMDNTFKTKTKPFNKINKKNHDYKSDDYQSNNDISDSQLPSRPSGSSSDNFDDAEGYGDDITIYSPTNKIKEFDVQIDSDANDNDKNKHQVTENVINKSSLVENIELLLSNKKLDMVYGFNIDESGNWRYGNNELNFNADNSIKIGSTTWKMTPGLFELVFHSKPIHYTKNDLKNYKELLKSTNVHRRQYQSKGQIKGSRAFKYVNIIKHLFTAKPNISKKGSGLSLKSVDNRKPSYIYWDDPNELVDRLRLLLSSESAGHNNHKNEIIAIVEELREANIIY